MTSAPPSTALATGPREVLLLLLLSLMWGSSFMFIKLAVATVTPLTLVAARLAFTAAVLAVFARLIGARLPRLGRAWWPFVLIGVTSSAVPFFLIGWGEQTIDSNLAGILIAAIPIFAILFAHWLTHDERLTSGRAAGVAVGFLGIVVLVGPEALSGLGDHLLAQLAIVGAAASYGFNTVIARRVGHLPAPVTAAASTIAATVIMVPLALIADRPWTLSPSAGSLWALAALVLIGTAAAQIVYFRLIARAGATFTASVNYLIPLNAVAWGVLLLDEVPSPTALIALVMILIGIALIRRGVARQMAARERARSDST